MTDKEKELTDLISDLIKDSTLHLYLQDQILKLVIGYVLTYTLKDISHLIEKQIEEE